MDPQSVLARAALPEIWHFHHSGRDFRLPEVGSRDGSVEESTVTGQSGGGRSNSGGGGRRRSRSRGGNRRDSGALAGSEDESSRTDCDAKRNTVVESKDENEDSKPDLEENCGNCSMPIYQNVQPSEAPKQDFIQVRARRGQATDSHSLAERARREKISERMKILQGLVPGCNKVIGKALVLDEIINYIQSLQRQVEFLSMKLEVVNSRMEEFTAKDVGIQTLDSSSGMAFGSHPTREYGQGSPPEWLHMQIGSGLERAT